MAKRKSTKPSEKAKPRPTGLSVQSPAKKAVQEAGMITGQLKAKLKNVTTGFLDIGALLVQVRDRKSEKGERERARKGRSSSPREGAHLHGQRLLLLFESL